VSYTVAAVLGVAGAGAVDLALLRTRLLARRLFWTSYAVIVVFQLAVNGLLTGRGVVRYDEDAVLGPRVAWAPVEDLLFGFALVLLTLSVWVWLGRRGRRTRA
jgi:lycopene cyclase domain-containing protein